MYHDDDTMETTMLGKRNTDCCRNCVGVNCFTFRGEEEVEFENQMKMGWKNR